MTRWHQAYIREMEAYCDAVLENRQPTPNVYDGTNSTRIAFQCKKSFLENALVQMD